MTIKKRKTKLKKSRSKPPKIRATKKSALKKTAPVKKKSEIKINPETLDQEMVSAYQEDKVERDKKMIMWTGVSFFMVLILVGWTWSFKKAMKKINVQSDQGSAIDWAEISSDFSQTMDQMKQGLAEVKNNPEMKNNINNSLPENQDLEINKEEITNLKTRLEELEKKMDNTQIYE